MTANKIRNLFTLHRSGTEITKADFEAHFTKTDERIEFTFFGWDGKSYNGESRKTRVLRINAEGFEAARFVKVGRSIHLVLEDDLRIVVATGISHPTVGWVVDVARA